MRLYIFIFALLLSPSVWGQTWDTPCPGGSSDQGHTINPSNGHWLAWLCVDNNTGAPSSPTLTGGGTTIPSGLITLIASGSCPSGWTEVTALNGQFLQGTLAANGDVGTTGGSSTITPSGTVSQPTLAMNSYTPAGANSTASFTPAGTNGTANTGATSAGTPAGTNSTASLSVTGTKMTTSGSGTAAATTVGGITVSTSAQNATVPAETFTGSAMGTHTHTVPAETFTGTAGTVPAQTFTGTPATLTGTVSQPTFSGNAVDPRPLYTKVIFCSKN